MTEVIVVAVTVILVVVTMVAVVDVVVIVVIKTLVWAESVFGMLDEVLISVVVDVVAIALGFDVTAS